MHQEAGDSGSSDMNSQFINHMDHKLVRQVKDHSQVSAQPITAKCLEQLGGPFGCISLSDFQFETGPEVIWQSVPDIIQLINS